MQDKNGGEIMSLEIAIPQEITQYEAKLIGPLTTRQTVWSIIGCVAGIGAKMICDKVAPDMWIYASTLAFAPCGAIGFFKIYGMPFEQFAIGYIKTNVIAPMKRKSIVMNQFAMIDKEMNAKVTDKKEKYKKSKLAFR